MSLFPKLNKETDNASIESKFAQILEEINELRNELKRLNKIIQEAESRQIVVKLTK